jgi:hypothetical protein
MTMLEEVKKKRKKEKEMFKKMKEIILSPSKFGLSSWRGSITLFFLLFCGQALASEFAQEKEKTITQKVKVEITHTEKEQRLKDCQTFKNVDGGYDIVCGVTITSPLVLANMEEE